ncbi:hypothetical protein [Pedobacter steynii]
MKNLLAILIMLPIMAIGQQKQSIEDAMKKMEELKKDDSGTAGHDGKNGAGTNYENCSKKYATGQIRCSYDANG